MKLVTVSEMIAIEKEADSSGISYDQMMHNAGRGLADFVIKTYSHRENKSACGLIGKGNNGGDTLIALNHLQGAGWQTAAIEFIARGKDVLVEKLVNAGADYYLMAELTPQKIKEILLQKSLVMDGVFGTGIKLPLRKPVAEYLALVKKILSNAENSPYVLAVDCPSGLDCNIGDIAEQAIEADRTACMAAAKTGFYQYPGHKFMGEISIIDIGLPGDLPLFEQAENKKVLQLEGMADILPLRTADGHKGTFGTTIVIAGSKRYPGAALLSAKAAYKVGAGLVSIAGPAFLRDALAGSLPEATWLPQPDQSQKVSPKLMHVLEDYSGGNTAVVMGPGFGMAKKTANFIYEYFSSRIGLINAPTVIDADALKLILNLGDWWTKLPEKTILTPHPGEMSVLTGLSTRDIQSNRLEIAAEYAQKWGCVLVLKGAFTVVATPEGKIRLNPIAAPALAKAGSGDVLAGMIGGFLAQGMRPVDAAQLAVWIHARAGEEYADLFGHSRSMASRDIFDYIPNELAILESLKNSDPK